jgi:hypothetical protein
MVCLLTTSASASVIDGLADVTYSYGDRPEEVANPAGTPVEFIDGTAWPAGGDSPFYLYSDDMSQFWTVQTFREDDLHHLTVEEANASEAWAGDRIELTLTFFNESSIEVVGDVSIWFKKTGFDYPVDPYLLDDSSPYWSISGNQLTIGMTLSDAYPGDFAIDDEIVGIKVSSTIVPEPVTLLLMLAGGAISLVIRRRMT